MKEVKGYFEVVTKCGWIKRDLMAFETEKEATDWCDEHRWTWTDDCGFEWSLEIEDRDGICVFFYDDDFTDPYAEWEDDLLDEVEDNYLEYEALGIGWY